MNYRLIEKYGNKYIEVLLDGNKLSKEADIADLISACWENETNTLMLHADALSEDFFKLRTGLAGTVLQKLINYRIKTVLVMDGKEITSERFKEMSWEANKGKDFRLFSDKEEAEAWLLAGEEGALI